MINLTFKFKNNPAPGDKSSRFVIAPGPGFSIFGGAIVKPCECGCGEPTSITKETTKARGYKKGEPKRFILGHHVRVHKPSTYKNGRILRGRGYVYIYLPEHPFSNGQGYIGEHRLVAEKALGKYIDLKHPVHHHNGDVADNRPQNLIVCEDHPYHHLLHSRMKVYRKCGKVFWLKCRHCKQYDDPKNLSVNLKTRNVYHKDCHNEHYKEWRKKRA